MQLLYVFCHSCEYRGLMPIGVVERLHRGRVGVNGATNSDKYSFIRPALRVSSFNDKVILISN